MNLSVLYRGPLTSCNYACSYCPFSKRKDTNSQLERDRIALTRFKKWISGQTGHRWRILLTPWGEALVRSWYREAIIELSHLPHVDSVAVQTNLSCGVMWIAECALDRFSLWATYHPTETSADVFLRKVNLICELGGRICVGVVGVPDFIDDILRLKKRLPASVYLWINAQQPRRRPYTVEEIERFQTLDPQFTLTLRRQSSLGLPCRTGQFSFTVNGDGEMRRCHFVDEIIGNCYDADWEMALRPRNCSNRFCDCYLGKAQFLIDSLNPFYGSTVQERLATPEALSQRSDAG